MEKLNWLEKQKLSPDVISAECDAAPEEVDYDSSRLTILNQHIQSLIEEDRIMPQDMCFLLRV